VALILTALIAGCGSTGASRISGEGYSFAVPSGWFNATGRALAFGARHPEPPVRNDTAVATKEGRRNSRHPKSSVFVSFAPAPAGDTAADIASAVSHDAARLETVVSSSIPTPQTLDGRPTAHFEATHHQFGLTFRHHTVFVVNKGRQYQIDYVAPASKFLDDADAFLGLLKSWHWK
jgi:hypothetical protein